MEIKRDQLTKWKAIYAHGDFIKIADLYCTKHQRVSQKVARDRIRTAFQTGICREDVYPVIESYYKAIEKQLKTSK